MWAALARMLRQCTVAPFFHQRYPVSLTFDPSPDPVGEGGNRGDAVPGGQPVDGYIQPRVSPDLY